MAVERWDERYAARECVWDVTPNQFVERYLTGLTPGRAIDLAAGEGRNAIWLARQGWQVTAVDFSRVGLDKARRLAIDHGVEAAVELVEADALVYEPPARVDLVVIAYLQIPSAQQRVVLEHAAAWLRPGGTLFIVAHDRTNVQSGHGGPADPDVCYDVATTAESLPRLDIVSAEVVRREVETDDGPRSALDTLVMARRPE
jgi:SAM-dependent methyltransferase